MILAPELLVFVIVVTFVVDAAGYQPGAQIPFVSTQAGKESIFVVGALVILTGSQLIDWKFWSGFAYPFYAFTIFLLLLVLILGATIKGSTSWFQLGWFSFQPSELAKVGTIMALASFLSHHRTRVSDTRDLMVASGIILLPALLVLLQGDAGSALVFLSIFLVLFREGLAIWIPVLLFIFALLFVLALKFDVFVVLYSTHYLIHMSCELFVMVCVCCIYVICSDCCSWFINIIDGFCVVFFFFFKQKTAYEI